MDSQRWDKIQELFHRALDLPESEQDKFLRNAAGDDQELLDELLGLLEADRQENSLLDSSAGSLLDLKPSVVEGKRIGPYRIIRQIGSGGMGAVYLAERADGHFDQQVALKIIKRGMDTDDILARFAMERQILAGLNHPNIAGLFDGGITDDGLPWFSMEHIEGKPITDYCDEHQLNIRQRLALFGQVCRTVEYAQHNLVVHRDLKPSNILVTADGTVKLLDFGIAKLVGETADNEISSSLTRTGLRVMTPRYASPEQINGEAVTTASDVYSLGVVLYQLLTGTSPYRDDLPPRELERAIVEDDPTKPSSRFNTSQRLSNTELMKLRAESRGAQPPRLRKLLAGDIDTITTTALAKPVKRRYQSAGRLANDIERYLAGRPIAARAESVLYRTSRFLSRNRLPMAAALVVLLALISLVTFYTVRLANERDRAQMEASKARQVSDFLLELFESADPNQTAGETITVRQVLATGRNQIDEQLSSQPELQAEMLATLGTVFLQLGDMAVADTLYTRAYEIRTRLFTAPHEQIARSLQDMAVLKHDQGDHDSARVLYEQSLAMSRELFSQPDPLLGTALNNYAALLRDFAEYKASESLLIEALEVRRAVFGEVHADVAHTMNHLGRIYYYLEDYDRAEPLARRALEIRREVLGTVHVETVASLGALGGLLAMKNEYAESTELYTEALGAIRKLYGRSHHFVGAITASLANVRLRAGDAVAAESLFTNSLEILRETLPAGHIGIAQACRGLGATLVQTGRPDSAAALLREALELRRSVYEESHFRVAVVKSALGEALSLVSQPDEAELLLASSFNDLEAEFGVAHSMTTEAGRRLYEHYRRHGSLKQAEPFQRFSEVGTNHDAQ